MRNIEAGKAGENAATEFLLGKGYVILKRNYRAGRNELDIIACKDRVLVFVEVKTRGSEAFGYPEEAVGIQKEEHIRRASGAYLHEYRYSGEIRYDIISVLIDQGLNAKSIFHIEDAFFPGV